MTKLPSDNLAYNSENLMFLWNENLKAVSEYDFAVWEDVFVYIKNFLSDIFFESVEKGKSLYEYDENVFNNYAEILKRYNEILKLYQNEKNHIKNKDVYNIAEGIYILLSSKLEQLDENKIRQEEGKYKPSGVNINPLKTEREDKIFECAEIFLAEVFQIVSEFRNNFLEGQKGFCKDTEFIEFLKPMCQKIYYLYCNEVKKCVQNIVDLNTRPKLSLCYNTILREKDELESVIKSQSEAIERLKIEDDDNILNSVLKELQRCFEIVENTIRYVKNYHSKNSESENLNILCEYDKTFCKNIISSFSYAKEGHIKKFETAKIKKEIFTKAFYSLIAYYYKSKTESIKPFLLKMNKIIENECCFAKKLSEKFGLIVEYTKNNYDIFENSKSKDIIFGISETVAIKIENISESAELFEDECGKICNLDSLEQYDYTIFAEKVFDSLYFDWCAFDDKNQFFANEFKEIADKLLIKNGFPDFLKIKEKIDKKIMQLKREHIIFEVSTFEEIMNYSVSRLKESDEEFVIEYVKFINDIYNNIKYLLDAFNIQFIQPEPHSEFDAVKHNIIIAEKNEQFKKGEVIRLMNSGYMQNGNVILRANIIAAK